MTAVLSGYLCAELSFKKMTFTSCACSLRACPTSRLLHPLARFSEAGVDGTAAGRFFNPQVTTIARRDWVAAVTVLPPETVSGFTASKGPGRVGEGGRGRTGGGIKRQKRVTYLS